MAISRISLSLAAAALALAGGIAAAKNPMVGGAEMYETKTIVENAADSKDHTTPVAAVKAAGLAETLSGAGPFQVFARSEERRVGPECVSTGRSRGSKCN